VIAIRSVMVAIVGFKVYVERSERRIPAIRQAHCRPSRHGGQSTTCAEDNAGGVMPVILPPRSSPCRRWFSRLQGQPRYWPRSGLVEFESRSTRCVRVGHHLFRYFYISIVFNPNDVADNMRKHGGFIPGTVLQAYGDFINAVLTRLTPLCPYLILISFIPERSANPASITCSDRHCSNVRPRGSRQIHSGMNEMI